MKKLLLLLAFAGLYLFPAYGQVGPISITSSQCAAIAVGNNYSTVGIQVTGTWTGTLQAEVSIAGQSPADTQVTPSTSSMPTSTITANGLYTASVAGTSTFLLCGDTVASGTAVVYLNISSAAVKLNGGGGSGGSLVSSIAALNTAQSAPTGTVNTTCPSSINPYYWIQASDASWFPQKGVDLETLLGTPTGIDTHCRQEFFNDSGISTMPGASTQDDIIQLLHQPSTSDAANTPSNAIYLRAQTSTLATGNLGRQEGIYLENEIQGDPTQLVTGIDTGAGGVRGTVVDRRSGNSCTLCTPLVGLDGVVFANVNSKNGVYPMYGVQGEVAIGSNNGSAGGIVSGLTGQIVAGSVSGTSNITNRNFYARQPTGTLSSYAFIAQFYTDDVSGLSGFGAPVNTYQYYGKGDFFLSGLSNGSYSFWSPNIVGTVGGGLPVNTSITVAGGIGTTQYSTPSFTGGQLFTRGTAGATSYTYAIVARDTAGGVISSATQTIATGNATLDGTNFNAISLRGEDFENGAIAFYDIYRTASGGTPSTLGKIGTAAAIHINAISDIATGSGVVEFDDKGLAGDGSSLPTGNSTGGIKAYKFFTLTNCSSSASPAVCGASSGGSVVVAAAATSVVVDTTAVTANSQIFAQYDSSLGTKLGVTCNTTVALPAITSRTAGTSFTLTIPVAPTTNPACYSYSIVN